MSATVTKEFLTLEEFANSVSKAYGTVRLWCIHRRVKAKAETRNGRTYYRVPVKEAERVRDEIARGTWF